MLHKLSTVFILGAAALVLFAGCQKTQDTGLRAPLNPETQATSTEGAIDSDIPPLDLNDIDPSKAFTLTLHNESSVTPVSVTVTLTEGDAFVTACSIIGSKDKPLRDEYLEFTISQYYFGSGADRTVAVELTDADGNVIKCEETVEVNFTMGGSIEYKLKDYAGKFYLAV